MKITLSILLFFLCSDFTVAQTTDQIELLLPVSHKYAIQRLALSNNGRYFATGANDGYIKVWDAREASLLFTLGENTLDGVGVGSLCFTPDSKYLLSGLLNVYVWDVATGQQVMELKAFSGAYCYTIDISADSKTALVGCGAPSLWDIASGKLLRKYEQPGLIRCLKFSKDGSRFIAGWNDGVVRLFNSNSSTVVKEFKLTDRKISSVCFSNDDSKVIFADEGGTIYLCEVSSGRLINSFKGTATWDKSIVFTPDGNSIMVANGQNVQKINVNNGNSKIVLDNENLNDIAYSADRKRVLVPVKGTETLYGATDAKIMDLESGESVKEFRNRFSSFRELRFSPDNQMLATVVNRREIRIIDLSNITGFRAIYSDFVGYLNFSPDNHYLIFGHGGLSKNFLSVVDLSNLNTVKELEMDGVVSSTAFSSDGKLMIVGLMSGEVVIIDRSIWSVIATFKAITDASNRVYFSTDNKQVLYATASMLDVVDIAGKKRVWYYPHDVPLDEQKFPKVDVRNWDPEARTLIELFRNGGLSHREVISKDGHSIFISRDGPLFIKKDMESGAVMSYKGHQGKILFISPSNNNKLIATTADDNSIRIWDSSSGKTLVSYFAIDSADWFWITPDNYYYSSKYASRVVSFRKNKQIYRFQQFDLELNRPDLVMKNIGLSSDSLVLFYSQLVEKRFRTMGLKPGDNLVSFSVPSLDIANIDAIPDITDKPIVSLNVKATSANENLKKVNIWVNGVPVYHTALEKNKEVSGLSFNGWFNVPLAEGKNLIEVSAFNQSEKESLIKSISIIYTPVVKRKPDLYIVSIGVSKYKNYPDSKLKYADKDARDIVRKFRTSTLFGKIYSDTLTNTLANRTNILKIKNLFSKARPDDVVILSYSGHGLIDAGRDFYFATNTINLDSVAATAVSFKEMESLLDDIPSYKKMLLIDACYSGEVDKEEVRAILAKSDSAKSLSVSDAKPIIPHNALKLDKQSTFELIKESFLDLRRRTGTVVISSSSGVDVSYEKDKWQNGLFTYAVLHSLENIKETDLNGDGLYVSELIPFVLKTVKDLSGGIQVPTIREENIDFDFRIW
ncbi:caspase family protein [Mucilaginibacter angelicae]|uniref:Caspase family protein n=1 Tax=Mucilaginibacter angelicae TaxID=869718 RepID=A0ABV6L6P3_9SPHI